MFLKPSIKKLDKTRIRTIISQQHLVLTFGVIVKTKALVTILLFIFVLLPHKANGGRKTDFITLKERTCDGYLLTIYRGNSVDYRSFILIGFVDSLMDDQTRIKIEIEVKRKNGGGFEIPLSTYAHMTDSGTTAYNPQNFDPNKNIPSKKVYIHLQKWAVGPGDEIHLKIYDDINYSYVFERHIQIKKHKLGGNISFPILSVQRAGDHPGSLGAGISYTLRYIQPEKSLLNKLGFGLNFSFLDFDPDQKIEIGLGFVLAFPDDLFQVGIGKNLTVNKDSGYYFLGVNLPGIKEKIGL